MTADETPVRAGSTADIVRRMDRIESRQDTMETKVDSLAATVARVETNQTHATELNKLRFDALDSGLRVVKEDLRGFMGRIEGIIAGDVETNQTRQGQALVADYRKWRSEVDAFIDAQNARNARGQGMWDTLGGVKGVILLAAALASPLITVITILVHQPK